MVARAFISSVSAIPGTGQQVHSHSGNMYYDIADPAWSLQYTAMNLMIPHSGKIRFCIDLVNHLISGTFSTLA